MLQTNQLYTTNEVLTALLSHDVGSNAEGLAKDAEGYIAENYGLDLSAYDISVVENSDSTVHLVLPFYPQLEKVNASLLSDTEAEDVAGGFDIFVGAIVITAIIMGCSITAIGGAGLGIMYGGKK